MRISYKKIGKLTLLASLPLLLLVGTVVAQANLGDIDGNGKVDIFDYNQMLSDFNKTGTNLISDLNASGKVDIFDYNILLSNFGKTIAQASPSPSGMNMGNDSMAMMAWRVGGKNPPNPAYDKCDDGTDVVAAHNKYYVTAYDGKNYPTWHPPVVNNPMTGVGKCSFGHEHGTNPTNYLYYDEIVQHFGKDLNGNGTIEKMTVDNNGVITPGDQAGLPFGIANEHMDQYYNQEGRDSIFVRHEDHVGHKVELVNAESEMVGNTTHTMSQLAGTTGINIPYYTSGSNTFQPTGVSCAHLHKFHQGTHSGDAILNNLHEVTFHSTCKSVNVNNINAPAYYPDNTVILNGMMSFGKPGIYKRFCGRKRDDNICGLNGVNLSTTTGATCNLTDPLLSRLPDAINSNSLGRNMTDKYCLEHVEDPGYGISEGSDYFTPYEIWEGDFMVETASGDMLAEHGRQWDVLDPVRIIDIGYQHPTRTWQKDYQFTSEVCDSLLTKPGTSIRRTMGCDNGNIQFDSPQSAFKGLKRTTYFGRNRVSNPGGSQLWWTDPIGGNATTTAFDSGLKQKISAVEADIQRVQSRVQQLFGSNHFLNDRAIQRQFNNGVGTVHAPN